MGTPLFSKAMKIYIDASTVGCATDFSLSLDRDMIEVACMDASGAKQNIPDMHGWSVSGSGLVIRTATQTGYGMFEMADSLMNSDASIGIMTKTDLSANKSYSSSGYFSTTSMEGGVGAAVTYSFKITGSGPLEILTTP